ncbi:MAG TPA: glucokinase [Blastocatellia bacterium]|nr:glucokinase [Blastocatellia bacterium]
MILAGDIGGTKTNLGLFEVEGGALRPHQQQSFPSGSYDGVETVVQEFLSAAGATVTAAAFGVAGPVVDGRSETPNLAWDVDARRLARCLNLEAVALLNDLEATGHGIAELKPSEMITLNEGEYIPGNAALLAAGTGLGVASLFWDGRELAPSASEGGHVDFAPRNELEMDLLRHMLTRHQRVSVERIVSGPGIFQIYEFLRVSGHGKEKPEVAEKMKSEDPSAVIANTALAGGCELCVKALDMFVSLYGAAAGNVALLLKSTAGVYVGGGIAPKIIEKLKDGTFMKAFTSKGRLSPLLENMPVRIIMNDKTALLGAARVAARATGREA